MRRHPGGFTLAEVVVAVLIVTFPTPALPAAPITGRLATKTTRHRAQATTVLRARAKNANGLDYDADPMIPMTIEPQVPIDSVRGGTAVLRGAHHDDHGRRRGRPARRGHRRSAHHHQTEQ
ncbi:MAG: hypothetical protein JW889_15520 [Verrucomicrobia bacterium]|nr:hypothetical protein [Verrucomicrobiota bacterium]